MPARDEMRDGAQQQLWPARVGAPVLLLLLLLRDVWGSERDPTKSVDGVCLIATRTH